MKTVIEMAREAGCALWEDGSVSPALERFAELVRADALVKPCCGDFDNCQQLCMPRAAAQEREAIDQLVNDDKDLSDNDAIRISKAIRARGNK